MTSQHSKTMLLTGGSSGIGKQIAMQALARGWKVVAWSRSMRSVAEEVHNERGELFAENVDVTDAAALEKAVLDLIREHGTPDVLVNNAGIGEFAPISELSAEQFDAMISVNLRAPWLLSKLLAPNMTGRGSGIIAQLNSVASTDVFPGCTAYAGSKMGLLGVSRSLRAEVREHGVKVVDFFVGATKSNIWDPSFVEERGHEMMEAASVASLIVQTLDFGLKHPETMVEEIHVKPQGGNL